MKCCIHRLLLFVLGALLIAGCDASSSDNTATQVALLLRSAVVPAPTVGAAEEATAAAPNLPAAKASASTYHIGAVLSITGNSSSLGIPHRDALLMRQDQINQAGGITGPDGVQHPLELTIIDDASDKARTVEAVKQLLAQKVLAIIGPSTTDTSLAAIPLVTEARVPMVSLAGSTAIVEPVAERYWVFKTPELDRVVIDVLVNELKSRGLTNVAFLNANNGFGNFGRELFQKAAAAHRLNLVLAEQYDPGATDLAAQIQKVKASSANVLVNWSISPPAAVVTKSAVAQGLNIPIYHSHGVGNPTFIELAGPASEGVRFIGNKLLVAAGLLESDPQKPVLLQYIQDYTNRYNTAVSTYGAHAYDALTIVAQALSRSDADPLKLRDEIAKTRDYIGITGIFSMSDTNHNGLDMRGLAVIEIHGGKWQVRMRGGSRG